MGNASNTLSIWPLYDPRSNGKWKKLRQISAALIVAASEDVEDELRWTPDLDPTDIGVAVKNGVVTLTGFVRSYSQKYEAEKAAKRVVGVLGLANDLEVRLVGIPHARIATSGDPCSAKTDAS